MTFQDRSDQSAPNPVRPAFHHFRVCLIVALAIATGCGSIGIDHSVAKEGQALMGDVDGAERSYNAVGDGLLKNQRNYADKVIDQSAEIAVLRGKDANGMISAEVVLEMIRDNGKKRQDLYETLDNSRREFDKGKGHFVNARRMVSSIQSILDSLVRAKEAEAKAKAAGASAARALGNVVVSGAKSAGGIR